MSLKDLKSRYYRALAEGTEHKPSKETSAATTLVAYFRDMTGTSLLTAEREIELAKEIEQREIETWVAMLSYAPAVDHMLRVAEMCLDNSVREFRMLRRAAGQTRKVRTKASQAALERAGLRASLKLRPLDLDHIVLEAALAEVAHIKAMKRGRLVPEKLSFNPESRGCLEWVGRVRAQQRASVSTRNEFVKANLGLVVSVARRYQHGGLPLTDLIQEGNLGLIKAVARFDYRRGYRFSTYATWWIRHSIGRALADKGRTVRVPVHVLEANQRIQKARRELISQLGRIPTQDELAAQVEMDPDKLEDTLARAIGQSVSLDAHLGDEGDRERLEVFRAPDDEETTPYDDVVTRSLMQHVKSLLHTLKPIERDVLQRRFGLEGEDEVTLQEIASSYGLSRERIRQIQEQALSKVRRTLEQEQNNP
jgi:RNA polymerase primary sigma factor